MERYTIVVGPIKCRKIFGGKLRSKAARELPLKVRVSRTRYYYGSRTREGISRNTSYLHVVELVLEAEYLDLLRIPEIP